MGHCCRLRAWSIQPAICSVCVLSLPSWQQCPALWLQQIWPCIWRCGCSRCQVCRSWGRLQCQAPLSCALGLCSAASETIDCVGQHKLEAQGMGEPPEPMSFAIYAAYSALWLEQLLTYLLTCLVSLGPMRAQQTIKASQSKQVSENGNQ